MSAVTPGLAPPRVADVARKALPGLLVVVALVASAGYVFRGPILAVATRFVEEYGIIGVFLGCVVGDSLPAVGAQPVLFLAYTGGVAFPIIRHAPPFVFRVPVPSVGSELQLRARGVDSAGHVVVDPQVVRLPIRADQPPTVAISTPVDGANVTEGRFLNVRAAGQQRPARWLRS